MTYVIVEPCIGVKDASCVDVCPVDCIHATDDDAMYFIDEGEVVVRARGGRHVLGPGSFFGELALLEGRPRSATVTTLTACRLLELGAGRKPAGIRDGADPENAGLARAAARGPIPGSRMPGWDGIPRSPRAGPGNFARAT